MGKKSSIGVRLMTFMSVYEYEHDSGDEMDPVRKAKPAKKRKKSRFSLRSFITGDFSGKERDSGVKSNGNGGGGVFFKLLCPCMGKSREDKILSRKYKKEMEKANGDDPDFPADVVNSEGQIIVNPDRMVRKQEQKEKEKKKEEEEEEDNINVPPASAIC